MEEEEEVSYSVMLKLEMYFKLSDPQDILSSRKKMWVVAFSRLEQGLSPCMHI